MKNYIGVIFLVSFFSINAMELPSLKYNAELAQQASSNNSSVNFQLNINTSMPFNVRNAALSAPKIPNGLLPSDRAYEAICRMHNSGDLAQLKKECERLEKDVAKWHLFSIRHERAQLTTIRHFLEQPVMKLLEIIQNGSLAQAQQALSTLYVEHRCDGTSYTIEQVREANRIMRNRSDYGHGIIEAAALDSHTALYGLASSSSSSSSSSATIAVADLVTTTAHPVVNIHPEIDKRIEDALNAIKIEDKDFDQHMKAVGEVLNHLKEQGLLNPPDDGVLTPEMRDAIVHGIKHFIKEFKPENPLDNPQEFMANVVKYSAYASFHYVTGGAFLGAEKMAVLGMQLNALLQKDFSEMPLEQRAEYMAEQAAEIVKAVLADQVGKRVLPKVKLPGLPKSAPTEVPVAEVVTSTGEVLQVGNQAIEFKMNSDTLVSSIKQAEQITCGEYVYTKSSGEHFFELVRRGNNKGELARPYMRSPLVVQEIIATEKGIPDAFAKGALKFKVPGVFRGIKGNWELVIDLNNKIIYHFNFGRC